MTGTTKHIVIVSGMSGSGKTAAIRALEDAGFFCIDNLPVVLLPRLTELIGLGGGARRLALVVDARETQYLKEAPQVIEDARLAGHRVQVLFLDCSDEVLIRRFSETRRRHPLAPTGTVSEGISLERAALQKLRDMADHCIDTFRRALFAQPLLRARAQGPDRPRTQGGRLRPRTSRDGGVLEQGGRSV